MLAGLGWALAAGGESDKAREILAELDDRAKTEYVRPYELVKFHAALGEKDEAFACLERAHVGHDDMLAHMRNDITLRALHSDPRWVEFVARMHFPALSAQARGSP
jgi:hypothetical protein